MKRRPVSTEQAPSAVGPYSQAIRTETMVFASGQLGLEPGSGKLVEGVEAQTRQALTNLSAVLSESGSGMEQIVKTTIFLADMGDFAKVNAVYSSFFTSEPPARSTVQVAALPLGGLVEIEAVAVIE